MAALLPPGQADFDDEVRDCLPIDRCAVNDQVVSQLDLSRFAPPWTEAPAMNSSTPWTGRPAAS